MSGRVMIPKTTIKPLELVVSAIHCLKDKKGSSPQNIIRYLVGKYNVHTDVLKQHVQTGLKRGLSFGLITHDAGLYRLNDILNAPLDTPELGFGDSARVKTEKQNKQIRKRRIKRCHPKREMSKNHGLRTCRRRTKAVKNRKQRAKQALARKGRRQSVTRRQKQRWGKCKCERDESTNGEKAKTEAEPGKAESQQYSVSTKEQETGKLSKT